MMNLLKNLFGSKEHGNLEQLVRAGAVIVDVRSPQEFGSGHISQSVNIPLEHMTHALPRLKELNKPVITVCRSGARSSMAKEVLNKAGIEAHNGGAWTTLEALTKAG